jgi:hypothetical protein
LHRKVQRAAAAETEKARKSRSSSLCPVFLPMRLTGHAGVLSCIAQDSAMVGKLAFSVLDIPAA